MFARINSTTALNVPLVTSIRVLPSNSERDSWIAEFTESGRKEKISSYAFSKEGEAWDFVRRVVTDTARRDMLEIPKLDNLDKSQMAV